MNAFLS